MKHLIAILLVSAFAATGYAQDAKQEQEPFKDVALRLAFENASSIVLSGDVAEKESFEDVKTNLTNFVSNIFGSLPLFGGSDDDEDELPTNIETLDYDCSRISKAKTSNCFLQLKLTNGIKATYKFSVNVNDKSEPVSVVNNAVAVTKRK